MRIADCALIEASVERVVISAGSVLIHPTSAESEPIEAAWVPPPPAGKREILAADGHDRGIKAEPRTVLLRSIALGRQWLADVTAGAT